MRNLSRFAFALLLAACGNGGTINQNDPCVLNPQLPECIDGEPEGEPSAESVLFLNENGSAFFGTVFDDSPSMAEFIAADEAELAGIAVGTCVETDFPDIEGEPSRRSMGNVQLISNGTVLADLAVDPETLRYEEILEAGAVDGGDALDVLASGSEFVDPVELLDFLRAPVFPAPPFDPNTGLVGLSQTFTFPPSSEDRVVIRFSFIEGQDGVTLTCLVDGPSGTFTFDDPTFARLPDSGSLSMTVLNTTFRPLPTTDGVARVIRGLAQATANRQYQKL